MQKSIHRQLLDMVPLPLLLLFSLGCAGSIKTVVPFNSGNVPSASRTYEIGTVTATGDNVNKEFISLVRGHLEEELKSKNMLGNAQASNSNIINIEIIDYRMRGVMTRTFLGVLAGPDRVGSKVTVRSKTANEVIGQAEISSAALLAPMNFWEALAHKHAKEIVEFLAGTRS